MITHWLELMDEYIILPEMPDTSSSVSENLSTTIIYLMCVLLFIDATRKAADISPSKPRPTTYRNKKILFAPQSSHRIEHHPRHLHIPPELSHTMLFLGIHPSKTSKVLRRFRGPPDESSTSCKITFAARIPEHQFYLDNDMRKLKQWFV